MQQFSEASTQRENTAKTKAPQFLRVCASCPEILCFPALGGKKIEKIKRERE